jgi:hypothetical protein
MFIWFNVRLWKRERVGNNTQTCIGRCQVGIHGEAGMTSHLTYSDL